MLYKQPNRDKSPYHALYKDDSKSDLLHRYSHTP